MAPTKTTSLHKLKPVPRPVHRRVEEPSVPASSQRFLIAWHGPASSPFWQCGLHQRQNGSLQQRQTFELGAIPRTGKFDPIMWSETFTDGRDANPLTGCTQTSLIGPGSCIHIRNLVCDPSLQLTKYRLQCNANMA